MKLPSRNNPPIALTSEHFSLMGIGKNYWEVSLENIPAEGKDVSSTIRTYLERIEEMFEKGYGLFLQGAPQSGKTSLSVVVAKHLYSVYTPRRGIRFLPMQHFSRKVFDRSLPSYERCDFLILDDVGIENSKEFSDRALEGLIRYRCDNLLPTIVTTNLINTVITDRYGENMLKQIIRGCHRVIMADVNWAKINSDKMDKFFRG